VLSFAAMDLLRPRPRHPGLDRRRFLLTALAGALTAPLAAAGQPAKKRYRIGWLSPATSSTGVTNLNALREGLRGLGYEEGLSVAIEMRWADDQTARLPTLAAELVRLRVDVICTAGSQATVAAKQATKEIPIVFANVAFPLDQQLVASYARPGGNVTGVAFIGPEYGKRLELLREASPKLQRVALLYNPENPGSVLALKETQRWAEALNVTLEPHSLRGTPDLPGAFAAIARRLPDALMTTADPLIASHRGPIVDFAAKHRLLSMYPGKEFVDAGGLMFYGGSIPEMYRRAALYVDRILKGAKAGTLPVEQPIKFDMIVNLKTAKAFGLTIPPSLLLRADQVIE
jgi:putative tryptophan/tyrosine transport system substrate-binding protein